MSGERARLFVALELPGPARDVLVEWRDAVLGGRDGVRRTGRQDLHVTLCFLGWRDQREVEPIAEALGVVRGRGILALALGEPALLPRRRPRVLAVALEDPDGALSATQAAVSEALREGDWYQPDGRPFYAHVTVARAGRGGRIPRAVVLQADPPRLRFRASRVVLYRSRLRREGASYEPLARVALES